MKSTAARSRSEYRTSHEGRLPNPSRYHCLQLEQVIFRPCGVCYFRLERQIKKAEEGPYFVLPRFRPRFDFNGYSHLKRCDTQRELHCNTCQLWMNEKKRYKDKISGTMVPFYYISVSLHDRIGRRSEGVSFLEEEHGGRHRR